MMVGRCAVVLLLADVVFYGQRFLVQLTSYTYPEMITKLISVRTTAPVTYWCTDPRPFSTIQARLQGIQMIGPPNPLVEKTIPSATNDGGIYYLDEFRKFVCSVPESARFRFTDTLRARLAKLPEVKHPPDTFTGCHTETPHMLRLRSEYIKQNPQVWRTSATPSGATREDVEGSYADSLTRAD